MGGGILSGQDCAKGEAPARLGLVGDDYAVGIALIPHGMDAWDLVVPVAENLQRRTGLGGLDAFDLAEGGQFVDPGILPGELRQKAFGQGNGRAARRVELVTVMYLVHGDVIAVELVHDACEIAVHRGEYIYTNASYKLTRFLSDTYSAKLDTLIGTIFSSYTPIMFVLSLL